MNVEIYNRIMAERIIPGVVKMYNSGRIGNDFKVFESKDYYEHVLTQIFPKSDIGSFINGISIIPRKYIQRPNWHCVLIILPDDGQIGDAVGVGIIVDTKAQKAVAYSLEKSFKGYMICQWEDKKHFNFGSIPDKVSFFASIVPLASEEFDSLSTFDTETNKRSSNSYQQQTGTRQNPVKEKKKYQKNGNSKFKNVLRWMALPFAAILGSVVAYAVISLWIKGNSFGFSVYNGTEVGSITDIILAIAAQAVFGAAFVFCGAITAPSHRKICSVVLCTIICILSIISLIWTYCMDGFSLLSTVHILATCGGAIAVSYNFINSELSDYESAKEVSLN